MQSLLLMLLILAGCSKEQERSVEVWRIKLYLPDGTSLVYPECTNAYVYSDRIVFYANGRKHEARCQYHAEQY